MSSPQQTGQQSQGSSTSNIIPLPPSPPGPQLVTKGVFDQHLEKFNRHSVTLKTYIGFTIAMVAIAFISFTGFIIDAWRFHYSEKKSLQNELVKLENDKKSIEINNLKDDISELKGEIKNLANKIEILSRPKPNKNIIIPSDSLSLNVNISK